ncbi:TniQ family protein [Paraburkholderia panacisoli]|uniref:TniQ family protein n=1 Tax=Paraburkholderia panacisoli TaxID=2603818 RepID=A0A5B0HDH7_9BURK|nr:TniQ family protein [Paraburkholderia panacisoli]KAA1013152.1 TniQ family protein [Paraburkholderia panacisoli]
MQLPFTLPPYPDEILGSWLARNELHNGKGAWLALLQELGSGVEECCFFDIPDYSPELAALLEALGAPSYQQVLLNLTTVPYWLAFDAAQPEQGILSGTENVPLLHGQHDRLVRNPRYLIKDYRSQVGIRFCPVCLTQDIRAVGEPYWHRVHQLPNVTICPEHRVRLLSNCERCTRRCAPQHERRILLPRLACICGYDLSTVIISPILDEVRLKLVEISVDALRSGVPSYDRRQLHEFLLSKASVSKQNKIVAEAYGGYTTTIREAEKRQVSDVRWVWFPEYRYITRVRAVNVCALLAALKLGLPTLDSISEVSVLPADRRDGLQIPTVRQAQEFILRRLRKGPGAYVWHTTDVHYWVIRLLDPNWLTRHFPQKTALRAPPSIKDDRVSIKQNLAGKWRLKEVKSTAAFARARVRDQSWLRDQCAKLKRSRTRRQPINSTRSTKSNRRTLPPANVRHRQALRSALRAMLLDEGYPVTVTAAELGARAQLGFCITNNTLNSDPNLLAEVRQARRELPSRRIMWAVRQLQSRQAPISVAAVATCARLSRHKSSSELIRHLLGDLVERRN